MDGADTWLTLAGAVAIVGAGATNGAGAAATAGRGGADASGIPTLIAVTAAAAPPAAAAPMAATTTGASTTAIWIASWMNGQKIIKVWKMAQPSAVDSAGDSPSCPKNEARLLTHGTGGTATHRG